MIQFLPAFGILALIFVFIKKTVMIIKMDTKNELIKLKNAWIEKTQLPILDVNDEKRWTANC